MRNANNVSPERACFVQALTHGNLVWALLFPFLCLPLLRPRWLLIAAPILLQHLLSWRSSGMDDLFSLRRAIVARVLDSFRQEAIASS